MTNGAQRRRIENPGPVHLVQKALRVLEDGKVPSRRDPAVAETSLELRWGRWVIAVFMPARRTFEVEIKPAENPPQEFEEPWRRDGGLIRGVFEQSFAETVAGRIGAVIAEGRNTKKGVLVLTVPTEVVVDGQDGRLWVRDLQSRVQLPLGSTPSAGDHAGTLSPLPCIEQPPLGKPPEGTAIYDELLGIPLTENALHQWSVGVDRTLADGGPTSAAPVLVRRRDTSTLGRELRLDTELASGLRATLVDQLAASHDAAAARAGALVAASGLVLVGAPAVEALFESEEVPADWVTDIRLPFRSVSVFFTAPFEFGDDAFRLPPVGMNIPGWVADSRPNGDNLAALIGFTVCGSHGQLSSQMVWHIGVTGNDGWKLHSLPGDRERAALGNDVLKVVAWLSMHRPTSTTLRRRDLSSGASTHAVSQASVVELRIDAGTTGDARHSHAAAFSTTHVRRGHWRRQRIGPRHAWHYELRWIPPTVVGAGIRLDSRERVYLLPDL